MQCIPCSLFFRSNRSIIDTDKSRQGNKHEKYDLAGDVQEGNYEKLNPRAFTSEGNIFSRENFTINYIEIFVEGTVFSASQRNFSQDRRVDNLSDSEEEDDEVQQEFADDISQQVERLMNQV